MDYGAVAGGPDTDDKGQPSHEKKLRAFFDLLGITRPPGVESVGGLVTFVNLDPSVPPIIGDLYVGSHANGQGGLAMQMAVGQTPEKKGTYLSDYETIEDTMDGTIAPIDIDDTKIGPDPTTPDDADRASPSYRSTLKPPDAVAQPPATGANFSAAK